MSGYIKEVSLVPNFGGTAQKVTVGAASSAASAAFTEDCYVLVTTKVEVFMRTGLSGTTPTAVPDTDQILLANNSYRVGPVAKNSKLAFYSVAGGDVYITPQA